MVGKLHLGDGVPTKLTKLYLDTETFSIRVWESLLKIWGGENNKIEVSHLLSQKSDANVSIDSPNPLIHPFIERFEFSFICTGTT